MCVGDFTCDASWGGGGVSNQPLLTIIFDEFDFIHITFGLPVGAVGPFSVPLFSPLPSGRVLWSIFGFFVGLSPSNRDV